MDDRLQTLSDHLAATGERPVERTASRWLGEAEALARDLAESDLDPSVQQERLGKVAHLLDNVESTGDEVADDHVTAATTLVEALRTDGE